MVILNLPKTLRQPQKKVIREFCALATVALEQLKWLPFPIPHSEEVCRQYLWVPPHTDTSNQHHFILTSSYFTAVLLSHRCKTMISPVNISLCLFSRATTIFACFFVCFFQDRPCFVVGPAQMQAKCPVMTQKQA